MGIVTRSRRPAVGPWAASRVVFAVFEVFAVFAAFAVPAVSLDLPHALSKHTILTMSSTSRMTDWATVFSLSISAPVPVSTTIPHFWGRADGDWSTVKFPATAKRSSPSSLSSGRERVRLRHTVLITSIHCQDALHAAFHRIYRSGVHAGEGRAVAEAEYGYVDGVEGRT